MRSASLFLVAPLASLLFVAPARVARADDAAPLPVPVPSVPATPNGMVASTPATRKHTVLPWSITGIGAGMAAFGILSFVGAVKARSDVKSEAAAKHCSLDPTICPAGVDASNIDKNASGARAMDIFGVAFTATGGAALAGGLVWHFLEPVGPAKTPTALWISPWVGRGGGLVAQATF